ncbi:MAG: PQQ-dependent sugar dehydrogenase [Planctomycetota bacterium]
MRTLAVRVLASLLVAAMLRPVAAGGTPLTTVRIASGLSQPLYLTHAPGDTTRLFVVLKAGIIRVIENGVLLATPFLNIDPLVDSTTLEWGMLGLAFHPDYATNGYFFVNYSANGGDTIIARYQVTANPNVADPASAYQILYLDQPSANHRGGWLDFGPDGYLYDFQGDGGPQNDPNNRAQNLNLLLGKILRLDVDGVDDFPADATKNYSIPPTNPFVGIAGEDEIWAYGLRNPWRGSFDRATGDLWIADVGQFQREEVDFQPAGFAGGANYGWRCIEGTLCTGMTGCTCGSPTLTAPIHEYNHTFGVSITGGYVYRGCAIPDLVGTYFFADYQTERLWTLRYEAGVVVGLTERTVELDPPTFTIDQIASFGEDALGEIYIVDLGGEIFKVVAAGALTDCNLNGIADACDIATGVSQDLDASGVPDECEVVEFVRGDANADAQFNIADAITVLQFLFDSVPSSCHSALDANDDELVDIADGVFTLSALFSMGTPPSPPTLCGADPTAGALTCESFSPCP